jgi:1-acyl-sn-glycerol-3-phosphate acyltransferase
MIEPEQEMCENRAVYPSVKYEKPPTWAQRIRGFIYISIILVCPFLDMILVFVPMFFLVRPFLNKSQYRRFNSYIEKCFYTMISGLLELYGGMQVILTTEPNQKDFTFKDEDQILLIANHRSEVDWLFFW